MVRQAYFHCGGHHMDLDVPRVMGIINATPDSFSDGGRLAREEAPESGSSGFSVSVEKALQRAEEMQQLGASFVDIGGESTRPGATPVSEQEELDRVLPVVEAIAGRVDIRVSVDTSNPAVIREAGAAGAVLVNDVRALRREGALEATRDAGMSACLMHMQGEPGEMQVSPSYDNVVEEVYAFLEQRLSACREAGIDADRLLVDPGFGFGKTLRHNYLMLRNLQRFSELGAPLLVGMSRKSMIGGLLDKPVGERLAGSLAAAVCAVMAGASVVRTHDVAETIDALEICAAVEEQPVIA